MILIKAAPADLPQGALLVAQNLGTYECYAFAETGTAATYDPTGFNGRYKPRSNALPETEAELRADFFEHYERLEKDKAKRQRDADELAPVTVQHRGQPVTFDMDEKSQRRIRVAIEAFTALQARAVELGHPDNGSIPWTLNDDSVVEVTLTELEEARDAAAVRAFDLHIAYRGRKAELAALKPV